MRIDESFYPGPLGFVLDLDDVGKGYCVRGDEEVGCAWGMVVVCSVKGEFGC